MSNLPKLSNDCFALPPGVHWTPVDETLASLRERVQVVAGIETVSTVAAGGRVLAQDVLANRDNPPMRILQLMDTGLHFLHWSKESSPYT